MKSPRFVRPLWLILALAGCMLVLGYGPLSRIVVASKSAAPNLQNNGLSGGFQKPQSLAAAYAGAAGDVAALQSGARATALASSDLDNDGAEDLVAGYATANGGVVTVQRGNPDAFAPRNQSVYRAALKGKLPAFLPGVAVFPVPESLISSQPATSIAMAFKTFSSEPTGGISTCWKATEKATWDPPLRCRCRAQSPHWRFRERETLPLLVAGRFPYSSRLPAA